MSKPAPRVEGVSRSSETLLDLSLSRGALDRAAELRKDPDLLPRLLGDPATRVLELVGGSAEVVEARGEVALHLRPPHRGDLHALGLFLGRDEEGTSYVAVVGDPVDEGEPREWRSLRDVAVLLERPRLGPLHHRAGPRQLARQAHALPPLRVGHHGPARRLGAPLHERRDRALPAHRPGGDHVRRRRRRPAAAGPRAAVGRGAATRCSPGSSSPGSPSRRPWHARSTRRSAWRSRTSATSATSRGPFRARSWSGSPRPPRTRRSASTRTRSSRRSGSPARSWRGGSRTAGSGSPRGSRSPAG